MPSRAWFAVALVAALLVGARPGAATYRNARATGKRCATCHASPHPSLGDLNESGRRYLATRSLPGPGDGLPGLERTRLAAPSVAGAEAKQEIAKSPLGEAVFERACAPCHGPRGAGGEAAGPLRAPLQHAAGAEAIAELVRHGLPDTDMFGFEEVLGKDEIAAVADYVATLAAR